MCGFQVGEGGTTVNREMGRLAARLRCQSEVDFLDIAINERCQLTFGQRSNFLCRWYAVLE